MRFTLRSFLLFLRNLVSVFRRRWDQSARRLWYIFAFLRSRFSPQRPKKRDDTRRHIEPRPTRPSSATVICASRLHVPPPLSPIAGGHTPDITSPTAISIEVRQPTILSSEDSPHEPHENDGTGHLEAELLGRSGLISRTHGFGGLHGEPESIRVIPPQNQNQFSSDSPVTPSRPNSRPPSQHSYRPSSQYGWYYPEHHQGSQYSYHPQSEYSYRSQSNLDGAEAAARGYIPERSLSRPPSLTLSVRPPSMAGSTTSRVYQAQRPRSRVRRPSPIDSGRKGRGRSSTPASVRKNVHEPPPEAVVPRPPDIVVPEPPQPEPQTTGSAHRDRNSTAISFGQPPSLPPKGTLRPMVQIDRYEKHKEVVIPKENFDHVCPPVTTHFTRESIPDDWRPLMHPEGALYWVHEKDPIYTDTNMCDPVLRQRIKDALQEIDELKELCPPLPANDWELALELGEDGETGELVCSYYFVRLSVRCLFWLHEFDLTALLGGLYGVTEWTHIHLALQVQHWSHWEMFPHDREVPENVVRELLGILVHWGVDCMTSPNSTAAYSEMDLNKLLGYVGHITSVGGNYGFSACVVGRLMSFFVYTRYINFYGQRGARLTNDQTIHGHTPKRTYLIKTLSIFFFYAPELHLRGLESVYTDFILCQHRWAQYIKQLQNDWTEFILYGTVLLNANVAFLAIPSVDPGTHTRTPTQLASYLSIITSVGSIVIGLLLLRQNRAKPQESSGEVDNYLRNRSDSALGFETLAILYSLPYALLLWSTMAFTTAFCLETLVYSRQQWARLSVGVVVAMMILLISWCIWTTIEAGNDFSVLNTVSLLKNRLVEFTKRLRGKTSEPSQEGGEGQSGDGESENDQQGVLKKAFTEFTRRRRRRRRGISTSSTLVNFNPTGGTGAGRPSDVTGVELGGIKHKRQGSEV